MAAPFPPSSILATTLRTNPTTIISPSPQISHPPRNIATGPRRIAGTLTQTLTQTSTPSHHTTSTLHLRGAPSTVSDSRVRWASNVIDNEGLGRKTSKVCCIYHAPRAVGDSSSEDSSDSESSDESDGGGSDDGRARLSTGRGRCDDHDHGHGHEGDGKDGAEGSPCGDEPRRVRRREGKWESPRASSPNAYEKQPKVKRKNPEHGTAAGLIPN